MPRILSVIIKDFHLLRKDNLITYMMIIPLIMILLLSLYLPFLENMELTFAISRDVPEEIVDKFKQYGKTALYEDRSKLIQRVLDLDDVPGITMRGKDYEVILEGNEASYVQELPEILLNYFAQEKPVTSIEIESLGVAVSPARAYLAAFFVLGMVLIAGLVAGFTIIEEKESQVLRAYAVTPLSIGEYFLGKVFFVAGLSFILAFLSAFILLGNQADYGSLFWTVLMALPTGLLVGMIIGTYAGSQLGAVALLKGLFFFLMAVPLGSFFVDKNWQFLFYPFFNYWVVKAFLAVFLKEGGVYLFYGVIALLTTLPLLSFVMYQMRRRLSL